MKTKDLRHGFVEINIDKERKHLDLPKNEKIFLYFDYNAIGDADSEMKKSGTSTLRIFSDPSSVDTNDVRILLGAGLRHQFPTITTRDAGTIMAEEDYFYVLPKCVEAVSYAMEGWFADKALQNLKNTRVRAIAIAGDIESGKLEVEGEGQPKK